MKHIKLFEDFKKEGDDFFNWLSLKMNINISEDSYLGHGFYGVTYDIGKNRVLKLTRDNTNNQEPIINKNIDGVAKVYSTGLITIPKNIKELPFKNYRIYPLIINNDRFIYYTIMEKLETENTKKEINILIDELKDWYHFNRDNRILYNEILPKNKHIKINDLEWLKYALNNNSFLNLIYDFLSIESKFLLKEVLTILKEVFNYYPTYNDIHKNQFGRDKNGNLKIFDLSEDNNPDLRKQLPSYKKVKNFIK